MTQVEKIRELLRHDLIKFGRAIRPKMAKVKSPEFHQDLNWLWQNRQTKRKAVIQAPRGTAKSEISASAILHHICYDEGDKFILLVSKTLKHAKDVILKIQNTLSYHKEFHALFGRYTRKSPTTVEWNKTDMIFRYYNVFTGKEEGIRISARGMEQPLVGLNFDSQRPTLVMFDDPEDDTNTKTSERIESNYSKLKKSILPGLDPKRGVVWLIGTPQCEGGMVNRVERLAKKTGQEKIIRDGCECYDGSWYSLHYRSTVCERTKTVLWPEWMSWEELQAEKSEARVDGKLSLFYSEYECELIGDEDQDFRPEDMRYYAGDVDVDADGNATLHITGIGADKDKLTECDKKISVNIYTGIDPASSKRNGADYSTIVSIAYTEDEKIFILPYYRKRVNPFDHGEAIVESFKELKPKSAQVEAQGYQEFMREFLIREMRKIGVWVPGLEVKWTTSVNKVERLKDLIRFFRRHKVYLLCNMEEIETELFRFPRAQHDDLMDGLWYATRRLIAPHHAPAQKVRSIRSMFLGQKGKNWLANC